MENKTVSLKELYIAFFKVGLFTFGGGLAMLPIIEREIANNKKWTTYEELLDYYAVAQTTPGIIMVNVSTFVGYKKRGIIGAIVSTLAVISPSLIIISLIATFIENFASIGFVQSALKGIAAGISAIMVTSLIKLGKSSILSIIDVVLCLIGFTIAHFTNISIIYAVCFGVSIGILRYRLKEVKK